MKIVKTIVFSLFALLLVNGGLNKFLNYMPMPASMPEEVVKDSAAMVEISWLMPLLAIVEILGGLLILIPKTRALGALVIFPVMMGILLTHILVAPDGLVMALIIWVILIWIIIDNWRKYLPIVK